MLPLVISHPYVVVQNEAEPNANLSLVVHIGTKMMSAKIPAQTIRSHTESRMGFCQSAYKIRRMPKGALALTYFRALGCDQDQFHSSKLSE